MIGTVTCVIAFDVNETLLDLSALDARFEKAFGTTGVRPQWFALMLQLSLVGGVTDAYVDFGTAQHAALQMLAERHNVALPVGTADEIVGGMSALPAYPDVVRGLAKLTDSPFEVVWR